MTGDLKNKLIGDAKFIRAFCYFNLVNMFGDLPLVLSVDWKVNANITRASKNDVYQQIVADLLDARERMNMGYTSFSDLPLIERVRPNKSVLTALLSRTYLYQEDWQNAELESSLLINDSSTYRLELNMNDAFIKNNVEAIWQFEPRNNGFNSPDGVFISAFLINGRPTTQFPLLLDSNLVSEFAPGDQRRNNWVQTATVGSNTYYFPYKYKLNYTGQPPAEYTVVLRLAEQYLIRAEARAWKNDLMGSAQDLNRIRERAGLPNTLASTKEQLIDSIMQERRFELFAEYGHRWFDLKRTNKINEVMSAVAPLKGASWQSTDEYFPIPVTDIQNNPKMTQNPGYN